MKTCSFCGELKPCLKVNQSLCFNGQSETYFSVLLFNPVHFNWACKECAMAKELRYLEYYKKQKIREQKRQANWIKQRDKLLNKSKGGKQ